MGRHPTRRAAATLIAVVAIGALRAPVQTEARDPAAPGATLAGHPIPLADVGAYDCHDRDYPTIRCFRTLAELRADELMGQSATSSGSPTLMGAFVRWFADANYGGSSFDAYYGYADLSAIGWNDRMSSFQPLNAGHPLWWQDVNYTDTRWDWGTAVVSYVGAGANDQFSSVQKG